MTNTFGGDGFNPPFQNSVNHSTSINYAADRSSIYAPGHDLIINHYGSKLPFARIGESEIESVRSGFVSPEGYYSAREKLRSFHLLVLQGERKTGRKTGAYNLLADIREDLRHEHGISELCSVRPTWVVPRVDALPEIPRTGFLLDLSDTLDHIDPLGSQDMRPSGQFGEDLVSYAERLARLESFLILVTTNAVWESCAGLTYSLTENWVAPAATAIVAKWLRVHSEHPERIEWLSSDSFGAVISGTTIGPADAVRLARAIDHAEDGDGTSAQDVALDEFKHWESYLRSWFKKNEDVYDRALLIAAAALGEKATDRDILSASRQLLEAAKEESSGLQPLRTPDLVENLDKIGADHDSERRVSLNKRRPGLDESVMDWVWEQRPEIRTILPNWLAQLATAKDGSPERTRRISKVLAGLCVRRGAGVKLLMDFVSGLAEAGGENRALAVRVVDEVVLDPGIGRKVRDRLLAWSAGSTPARLSIVAEVCGGKLGENRTELALRRIGRILSNESTTDDVLLQAGRALGRLARQPELRMSVVAGIAQLLLAAPKAGARAFLELCRLGERSVIPQLLRDAADDTALRETIAAAWVSTYEAVGRDACAPVMCSWVAAIGHELPEESVLSTCLPTLRMVAISTLDSDVIKVAADLVRERILRDLYCHRHTGTST